MSAATAMKLVPRRIERVLLIVNPASGRGDRIRRKALKAFSEAGVDCDMMRTEAPGRIALMKDGKLEIVVDRDSDFEDWLTRLEPSIRSLMDLPEPD